jgi:enoyl-CoA hydratase
LSEAMTTAVAQKVLYDGLVWVININRPHVRNAIDRPTATALKEAFLAFDKDPFASVAVLHGSDGNFCAGADLKAVASGSSSLRNNTEELGPMGPSALALSKPVIAAIDGCAVAGGLELACWCDLRVASKSSFFGVFCRRIGVPLIDGGTVRLPRLIGQSRAADMILTGRRVGAEEAYNIGLVNRLVDDGAAVDSAIQLAKEMATLPQACLRNDRASMLGQWGKNMEDALKDELFVHGHASMKQLDPARGAEAFLSMKSR